MSFPLSRRPKRVGDSTDDVTALQEPGSSDGSIGAYYHTPQPPAASAKLPPVGKAQDLCAGIAQGRISDLTRLMIIVLLCTSLITFLQVWNHEACSQGVFPSSVPSTAGAAFPRARRGMLAGLGSSAISNSLLGGQADTLVVYIYSPTDPEYENNLRHFLRQGVSEGDGCEYVFIIQQVTEPRHMLPLLPRNGRYLYHENDCFDWGSFGWAIREGHIEPERYRYVIVVNSSVRGPFLPSYWPRDVHWTRILTSRLTGDIKLVGPTISCEGTDATETHPARKNPHVQSYVVAMDQDGYRAMRAAGTVFECHHSIWDTIYHAELGSSLAVLEAGHNIDSLMLRYHGVDWRDRNNWDCNSGVNPYAEDRYDGISVNPLEVMFVKVKEFMLQTEWMPARFAKKYDEWSNQMVYNPVHSNRYMDEFKRFAIKHVWSLRLVHPECFDIDFYLEKNPDLPRWDREGYADAFFHYMGYGQFEGRPFRLRCDRLWDEDPSGSGKSILPDMTMIERMHNLYAEQQQKRAMQNGAAGQQLQSAPEAASREADPASQEAAVQPQYEAAAEEQQQQMQQHQHQQLTPEEEIERKAHKAQAAVERVLLEQTARKQQQR